MRQKAAGSLPRHEEELTEGPASGCGRGRHDWVSFACEVCSWLTRQRLCGLAGYWLMGAAGQVGSPVGQRD
jgi:hypothetical protein